MLLPLFLGKRKRSHLRKDGEPDQRFKRFKNEKKQIEIEDEDMEGSSDPDSFSLSE